VSRASCCVTAALSVRCCRKAPQWEDVMCATACLSFLMALTVLRSSHVRRPEIVTGDTPAAHRNVHQPTAPPVHPPNRLPGPRPLRMPQQSRGSPIGPFSTPKAVELHPPAHRRAQFGRISREFAHAVHGQRQRVGGPLRPRPAAVYHPERRADLRRAPLLATYLQHATFLHAGAARGVVPARAPGKLLVSQSCCTYKTTVVNLGATPVEH
jgi:hypothetical protein